MGWRSVLPAFDLDEGLNWDHPPSRRAGFAGSLYMSFPAGSELVGQAGELLVKVSDHLGGELGFVELVGKEEALA
jgi:hypothetical protein